MGRYITGSTRTRIIATVASFALLFSVVATLPITHVAPVDGLTRSFEDPTDNPDLEQACGLNVLMILDESGSVGFSGAEDLRSAFKAFIAALKNTSSSMAVAEFSNVARLPQIGSFGAGEYITITDATQSDFNEYIDNGYKPGGTTNWEDGLRMGNIDFAVRPSFDVPHLTVFITDGNPTKVINRSKVTDLEYQNKVPLENAEATGSNKDSGTDAAISNANGLKAQGSHILAIAVGNGLSSDDSLARIAKVSGPNVYDGSGTFDVTTDDIYQASSFLELEDALRDAAFQLCSPSVTVEKIVDLTPDPDSFDDALPGSSWSIDGAVTAPGSGGYDWVLPTPEKPGSGAKSALTDGAGFATFQWQPYELGLSTFTATEALEPGFTNDQNQTSCTFRTPDSPDAPLPIVIGDGTFTAKVPIESIVTCIFVNIADPAPGVELVKFTNGVDANNPPGPSISVGEPVTWTYVVTNTGNTRLDGVSVVDDQGVSVACPETSLDQGETMTCTATGTATAGQYANLGTVFTVDSHGTVVTASDASHYFGDEPGLNIEKATNGEDADFAPGVLLAPGSTVTWSYVVTNTSATFPISGIVVTDRTTKTGGTPVDISNPVSCPKLALAPGESMTCTERTESAVAGRFENVADATGIVDAGRTNVSVSASDPSHYFAVDASVEIEKSTNGDDADTPSGPVIPVGDPVHWRYVVTNTGNFPLTSWQVTDDQVGAVKCPKFILLPGRSATCSANGTAVIGQYSNTAVVNAADPLGGADLTATDSSHYFGAEPALSIEKYTNGFDADTPLGPFITPGDPVNWTYEVHNSGNVVLTNVVVTDSAGAIVTCPTNTLEANNGAPGGQDEMTCTANGVAISGQYANQGLVTGIDPFGGVLGDTDESHYFGALPGIGIIKLTNGVDADDPPGPPVPVGEPVEWTYFVWNTGNLELNNVAVTDDIEGSVSCPETTLGPADSVQGGADEMICTAIGTAALGQYVNEATAFGDPIDGNGQVTDSDASHYLGYTSVLAIEKSTNGQDADLPWPDADVPLVAVGELVTWNYEITSLSNVDIEIVSVADDQPGVVPTYSSGDANGDGYLNPTETWIYTATGSAVAGEYENLGSAEGFDEFELPVDAVTDPSHYFGVDSSIAVEKSTNGEDADFPPGPRILVGDPVDWTYEVTNTGNVDLSSVVLTDDQGVTVSCPATTLAVGEAMTCTASGTSEPGFYSNVASATALDPLGAVVDEDDPSHYFGSDPQITIEKSTNGDDADATPGPFVAVGDAVEWTYQVTNTGNTLLFNIAVVDDQGVTVTCPFGVLLPAIAEPLNTMTCTASGVAAAGQYRNIATVVAEDIGSGTSVSDADPSHYFGSDPQIAIEKWTNGEDADTTTGPYIPVGDNAAWTYFVAATGNVPLTNVQVTDDQGALPVLVPASDTNDNGILDIGEVWVYMASAPATAGQYENTGSASGDGPAGQQATDDDPSHYFGAAPGIEIEKATNGEDADTPTGPHVLVGENVSWTYAVTNTGNVALEEVSVTDDQGVTVTCPQTTLAVSESMTCTASAPASEGQYVNVGSVVATDLAGTEVTNDDLSHYFGADSSIVIESLTDREDADVVTGPYIPVGDDVPWAYLVYTLGSVPLSNVTVTDDQGVAPVYLGGDTNNNEILDSRELWIFAAVGTSVSGQYSNMGTATGTPPGGLPDVVDTDPSHYFGIDASIEIQKTPDLTYLQLGLPHTFTITITNSSNVDLTDVIVSDPLVPACDADLGTMAPGQIATYECTVESVTTVIDNIASVDGTAPDGTHASDTDSALVGPWNIAGTSTAGGTVWQDTNKNGVQDTGEPGIEGAKIDIYWLDGTDTVMTYTTDANGMYAAVGLVEGNYRVEIDLTSVDSELTTAGSYTFFLSGGESMLLSNFGIFETLPVTGSESDRIAMLGLILLLVGVAAITFTRRRYS